MRLVIMQRFKTLCLATLRKNIRECNLNSIGFKCSSNLHKGE